MAQPNGVNLARGVMMGLMATLGSHPELDPIMTFLAVRNEVDEQLDIMLALLGQEGENGLHDIGDSDE